MACNSNKIAQTPTQGFSAEVTPSAKMSKREQVHYKKRKQDKKKELVFFFGQGPRVPALLQEGTPIDVVVQIRENRRTNLEEGKRESPLKEVAYLKGLEKVNVKKKPRAEENWTKRIGGRTRNVEKEQEEIIT